MMPFWASRYGALRFGVPLTVFSIDVGDFGPRWRLLGLMAQNPFFYHGLEGLWAIGGYGHP